MSKYDDENYYPTTLEDAVACIVHRTPAADLAQLATQDESDLIMHHFGWGMGIRNGFRLWHNTALLQSCGTPCADDASGVIIKHVWTEARQRYPQ